MTKWGETNNFKASDFAKNLLSYVKKDKIDYIICNNSPINKELIEKYKEEKAEPVIIDKTELEKYADNIIEEDVSLQAEIVRHDAKKIASVIMGL